MKKGDMTPWGPAETVQRVGFGDAILDIATAGHGGFLLSHDAQKMLLQIFRGRQPRLFCEPTEAGYWYEEDCDAVIVIVAFPGLARDREAYRKARLYARHWHPELFTKGGE